MASIEICGGIAAGKTSLCKTIGGHRFVSFFEDFKKNPFWKNFYSDPVKFSFETELTFLLQHYSQIKASAVAKSVYDFSLIQDIAYADINLSGNRHELFLSIERELRSEIGFPTILIYVYCPEVTQLQRIQARNRRPEQSITDDYLRELNIALEKRILQLEGVCHVVRIDSSKVDFRASIPSDIKSVICNI